MLCDYGRAARKGIMFRCNVSSHQDGLQAKCNHFDLDCISKVSRCSGIHLDTSFGHTEVRVEDKSSAIEFELTWVILLGNNSITKECVLSLAT